MSIGKCGFCPRGPFNEILYTLYRDTLSGTQLLKGTGPRQTQGAAPHRHDTHSVAWVLLVAWVPFHDTNSAPLALDLFNLFLLFSNNFLISLHVCCSIGAGAEDDVRELPLILSYQAWWSLFFPTEPSLESGFGFKHELQRHGFVWGQLRTCQEGCGGEERSPGRTVRGGPQQRNAR